MATAAGIRVFSFVVPLAPPASYMAPGVAGFMIVGVIYLIYLYRPHPERVTEVGLVHIDAPELQPVAHRYGRQAGGRGRLGIQRSLSSAAT
jgi:hypothetical protein